MNSRIKKIVLLLLAGALLAGTSRVQQSLNRDRERLGLTRVEPLENAPPMLALTTVALGGFRGLISNVLWMRAIDLQDQDKYFEMVQLADWITKLEPHIASVWRHEAWNMAYNISVKFKDFPDRWRWLKAGISLLRDEGLRYNPNSVPMYGELAWFFQNKLGADLDDASAYYKGEWMKEMIPIFGREAKGVSLDTLIHPQTDGDRARTNLLRGTYHMDPVFMEQLEAPYGPLEWRLPDAHAIYWAAFGLAKAKEYPVGVDPDDLIVLHRSIYQSMLLSFQRGRLILNPYDQTIELAPNLELIPKVNASYEEQIKAEEKKRGSVINAHWNFLGNAVYFLYQQNRLADAANWYRYLGEHYPDRPLLYEDTNSLPRNLTLDEYAVARTQGDINDVSPMRVRAALEGLLVNAFRSLIIGEDDRAAGFQLIARKILANYERKLSFMPNRSDALKLPSYNEITQHVLDRLLDPQRGLPPQMRAVLRAKYNLGPEPAAAPASTNAPAMTLRP